MKTIILRSECKPLSDHIEGKLVVIGIDHFSEKYKDAKYQIVLACGGFGCDANKMGTAVFVEEIHNDNPEDYRRERFDLIGEPTEEMIVEWKSKYGEFNARVQRHMKEFESKKGDVE